MNSNNDKKIIAFVNQYFEYNCIAPSIREIANGTGLSAASVHRYLCAMNSRGILSYCGRRNIRTDRMELESDSASVPVIGLIACGEGQPEVEEILEYIRLPNKLIGRGRTYALIAKGESMIGAGINPGDYIIVDSSRTPRSGDIVVALYEGKNNLKRLRYDNAAEEYVLESCNMDKAKYPDIRLSDLEVQGVAVCVIHRLMQ